MKVIEANETLKPIWDSFIGQSPHGSITQSWQWGQFKQNYGENILRVAVTASDFSDSKNFLQAESKMLAAALLIKRSALGGRINYYYAPYGPVVSDKQTGKALKMLLAEIEKRARAENIAFLRAEPQLNLDNYLKVKPQPETVQAQHSLIMDISDDKKKILKNMKSKHRYNIRLSKRKGVKVEKAETVEQIDKFWQLLARGARENDFSTHPKEYYATQFETLSAEGMEDLFLAKNKKGKVIAANLIGYFGKEAYYFHGAMDKEYRNLMAPHLLQWEAIIQAKKKEAEKYNFWGVAPPDAGQDHPWQGFTRFKKGFCPETEAVSYPGAYYLPYSRAKFQLFKTLKKGKKWLDL